MSVYYFGVTNAQIKTKAKMNKTTVILALSCLIFSSCLNCIKAQQSTEPPRLVISIVVDQLRGDYLQYFSPTFGDKGFKRLMNEGLYYHNLDFGIPNIGPATSTATIYTGAYPFYHGIVADKNYDFETGREMPVIHDDTFLGNFTVNRYSPLSLLSSTIGDELKIASLGKSDVFSIAPNAEEAIISAGRYADAAFWLDDTNGKWANTTYYKNIPWYVERFNMTQAIGNNPERIWTPALVFSKAFPYTIDLAPFKHTISKNEYERFLKIKQSPFINEEITNLVATFFQYADFGKRMNPDFLSITYYAGNFKFGNRYDDFGLEIQDIYFRLDKEIEKLLDLADKSIGLKNVLVILTSNGYYDSAAKLPEGFKPLGEFYPSRCTALLNMYLMALYGSGNWVEGYYNEQIYLNKKLIEDKNIDRSEIILKAAEFVTRFSGVQEVTTAGQWYINDTGRSAEFRRGMNKKISGDIFVELQPGWKIINENKKNKTEFSRNKAILPPLFIFGGNIRGEHVFRTVQATEIAPTVAFLLRIPPPNAAKDSPFWEFLR